MIKYFPNIKTLILSENKLTDISFKVICDNLLNLRKLFMNNNGISDEGMGGIEKLKNLRCLDLRSNMITDKGL